MHHDVWVAGHVTRDRILSHDGERVRPGGTAVYFPLAHARLGGDVGVLTRLAPEDEDELLAELRALGLEVRCAPSAKTTEFENRYGGEGDPDLRTQRVGAVALPFTVADLDGIAARLIHLGPLTDADVPLEVLRAASARARVSLDAQGFVRRIVRGRVELGDWPEKREGLVHVAVLKADEHEARVLTGEADPRRAARILAAWGPDEVLVTRARRGSVVLADGELHEVPAFLSDGPLDPTGCGDTYTAAYLEERLRGATPRIAACFASAAAALVAAREGAFDADRSAVEALLRG